ncbi:MAG: TonB family protein [Candidatus Eremiobacteraeota bacterium]|nr:TonB family protein [Candidatus Eremiobacteraeota bacterium]MBC5826455.1 TonB family protein [Candidatus Eremiobacteraeota bacterium]
MLSFLGFVLGSAALHFVAGPLVRSLVPMLGDNIAPEGRVSIITLSQMLRDRPTPRPATTPTPPPIVAQRTHMHAAPLKYRELSANRIVLKPNVHPPARRKVKIVLNRPRPPEPTEAPEALVAAPTAEPAQVARRVDSSAPADSGGSQDQTSGSIQWGDDNPARVIKQQPLVAALGPAKRTKVEVEVGPDGNPLNVKVLQSSGDAALDEAALEAARRSSYAPATLNGLPVHGTCIVEYPAGETNST